MPECLTYIDEYGSSDEMQINIIETILEHLICLTGEPGTGKSFLVKILQKIYKCINLEIKILAPTHLSAINVKGGTVASYLIQMQSGVLFENLNNMTIAPNNWGAQIFNHKAECPRTRIICNCICEYTLACVFLHHCEYPDYGFLTCDCDFIPQKYDNWDISVICDTILDELSMIGIPIISGFLNNKNNYKLIIVGDVNQLPPVGGNPVTKKALKISDLELFP